MLHWFSRCLPGISIALLILLIFIAFAEPNSWFAGFPSSPRDGSPGSTPSGDGDVDTPPKMHFTQHVFMAYTLLIHVNALLFAMRLCWALYRITNKIKDTLRRRPLTSPREHSPARETLSYTDEVRDPISFDADDMMGEPEVVHSIIVPNYCEEIETLQTTLSVLASHPRAATQYEIFLAMEEKEGAATSKAAALVATFEKSFLSVRSTFHPAGLPGEIAGKGSNVAYAARRAVEWHRGNKTGDDVIITVMDADTHLAQDYFTEIRRMHFEKSGEDAQRQFYVCPIVFDRNAHESPLLVRCADLLWGFAGLSGMYDGALISIPTSVYSLPLSMAERVGGWDSDATSIGEDMHMLLKCYFGTAGDIDTRVVCSPASQCNISSGARGPWRRYIDTSVARYRQALRHMWGALDTGFALRNSVRKGLRARTKHVLLMHLLWEAHFLPAHLTILLIFSSLYTVVKPASAIPAPLLWTFAVTGWLRAAGFVGVNAAFAFYDRFHAVCVSSRARDMARAGIADGFAYRVWYHPKYIADRLLFPIAGTLYGAVPALHAEIAHFWTDRLVYRVSKKPIFSLPV